jgi:hypothetical protein
MTSIINYREIFLKVSNELKNYDFKTPPSQRDIASIARTHYDEVYGQLSKTVTTTIWDGKSRIDVRSVEQLKTDLDLLPEQLMLYIKQEQQVIGLLTESPTDRMMLTKENIDEVAKKTLDDMTNRLVTDELVTAIVNELVEIDLDAVATVPAR